jgi:hypothetical protein
MVELVFCRPTIGCWGETLLSQRNSFEEANRSFMCAIEKLCVADQESLYHLVKLGDQLS